LAIRGRCAGKRRLFGKLRQQREWSHRRATPSAVSGLPTTLHRLLSDRSLETDTRAASAQFLRVDILGNEVIAIGKLRGSEGVEQQLAHVARRNACEPIDHRLRGFSRRSEERRVG